MILSVVTLSSQTTHTLLDRLLGSPVTRPCCVVFASTLPVPVRKYNPRVESPFPSSPARMAPVHRPPQCQSVHDTGYSEGLFAPFHFCLPMRRRQQMLLQHNLQGAGYPGRPDPQKFSAFDHKHGYILPVPEPIMLKPRPAGRPPPLIRQLERFPMPLSSSSKGGLVHPVKLFQELEQRSSDATFDTTETPCLVPSNLKHHNAHKMAAMCPKVRKEAVPRATRRASSDTLVYKAGHPEIDRNLCKQDTTATCSREAELQKKPCGQKQDRLERMGTLTRPKTPVAEIRDWFDREASNANKGQIFIEKKLYAFHY